MPKEDRRIIFDNEEVYKALFALCTKKQIKTPPTGQIISYKVDEVDPGRVVLTFQDHLNNDEDPIQKEYKRDFLAASLLLMCKGLGIPLAKTSKKSVLIKDDQVMLRAQL